PSFVVFPETGTWRCFGQCNEGGDLFKYVMKREGWDFSEALRHLAEKAGVELTKPTPQQEFQKEEYARLRSLLEEAAAFYHHHLVNTEAGKFALDYLHKRGLTDETIQVFQLGYAPQGWDTTLTHFTEKGFSQEDLLEAGLLTHNEESGRTYDRFRHRLMIPIREMYGKMAGFGARALDPDDIPKYLNSPQSPIFDKSSLLFGLDKARKSIRSEDQVVIVEGYLDVIAPYQAGFTNLVSPMGTALTENQLRMLKKLTRRIVMALDADAAGAKATMRGLEVARATMDRETDLRFNARGLLRQEGRLKADIRVTTLPEGMDPDEVVQENPENWTAILEAAKPIVMHVMDTLAADKDVEDPKTKSEIAAQVMPLIADIGSAIERDTYTQALARLLKVDERALMSEYFPQAGGRKPARRRLPRPPLGETPPEPQETLSLPADSSAVHRLEAHCLGIIMRHPEMLYRLDRAMKRAGLQHISKNDFQLTNHQEMFRVAQESLEQDFLEPINFTLDNLPLPLVDLADDIVIKTEKLNSNQERILEDLVRTVLDIRRRNLRQFNEQLRFLQEEAREQGNLKANEYLETMLKNIRTLNQLDKALGDRSLAAN
ncbi:MAG: DNA primase, partial [Anaerolineae bacterium]|nr:DNA primase [Anaerolineae bacterium]